MSFSNVGLKQIQILSDATPFAGADVAVQRALLQTLAASQVFTLPIKAAMDEATYSNIAKIGSNYVFINDISNLDSATMDEHNDSSVNPSLWTVLGGATEDTAEITISFGGAQINDYRITHTTAFNLTAGRYIESRVKAVQSATAVGRIIITGSSAHVFVPTQNDVYRVYKIYKSGANIIIEEDGIIVLSAADSNTTFTYCVSVAGDSGGGTVIARQDYFRPYTIQYLIGTIKSASIIKNANLGLRYWEEIVWNLVAGGTDSTIKLKILDSAGTPLHTNFVTIASPEYARCPMLRPVVLTATSGSQTVWNLASLSYADAFINELGVLTKVMLVELAKDGTNYIVLQKTIDFIEDITNPLVPKITLVSGTGVISGTSKLRASYIVNIPLSNTTIKVEIQLNRVAVGDTSPSITPLVGDATKYVGAGQVAIV